MTSPTVRRRRLSTELRRRRVHAGMTLGDVADVLEWSPAKLGHIETGIRKWPSVMEVSTLLTLYGVTGGQREAILAMARESRLRPWWTEYADVLTSAYVGNEAGATAIDAYGGMLVPDLLQTPEYTAALARSQGYDERRVQRMVAAFLKRQEVLDRDGLGRYHAIVEEDALDRVGGDPDLRHAQVLHLIELAGEHDRIVVQLLPTSAGLHAGAAGPFTVLGFEDGEPSLAFADATHGGSIVEAEHGVDRCRRVWRRLTAAASTVEGTLGTLRKLSLPA